MIVDFSTLDKSLLALSSNLSFNCLYVTASWSSVASFTFFICLSLFALPTDIALLIGVAPSPNVIELVISLLTVIPLPNTIFPLDLLASPKAPTLLFLPNTILFSPLITFVFPIDILLLPLVTKSCPNAVIAWPVDWFLAPIDTVSFPTEIALYPIAIVLLPTANVSVPIAIWFSPIFLRSFNVRAFFRFVSLVLASFKSAVNFSISALTSSYFLATTTSLSLGLILL